MNSIVTTKFVSYPENARTQLMRIRNLIFEAAEDSELGEITETLKWGEPSYLAREGSTVRIDWKQKCPHQLFVYFHCKTRLVDTFREVYRGVFNFEGNRAIVLPISGELPLKELKHCISMSLQYHEIKHLPLLGA